MYDPEYAKALAGRADLPRAPGAMAGRSVAGLVDLDASWRRAAARAGERLAAGKVPAEYRQIVREFFSQP